VIPKRQSAELSWSEVNAFRLSRHHLLERAPKSKLAQVVGDKPLPRTEAVSKLWIHIKKYNLQNPQNRREILADDKLEPIFGKKKVTMFEMNKLLAGHLK